MACEHEYEFAQRLTAVEDKADRNEGRIKKLESEQDALRELATSVSVLASRQETVEGDVREIKADVKSLTERPGKRWDGLVDKVLFALAGAFIAWLLAGAVGL